MEKQVELKTGGILRRIIELENKTLNNPKNCVVLMSRHQRQK